MKSPINAQAYREIVAQWAKEEQPEIAVEVGVYSGKLSKMLQPHVGTLYIVDAWKAPYMHFTQEHMDGIRDEVAAWHFKHPNVEIYHAASEEIADEWQHPLIDFWHTDGDHSYEGITGDINSWYDKVKPGGLMSGDNYEIPTVAKGVSDLLPAHEVTGKGRVWWYRKPV